MNISQKKLMSVVRELVNEFVSELMQTSKLIKNPDAYSVIVESKKRFYLSKLDGIKRFFNPGTKEFKIITDAEYSIDVQAKSFESTYQNDFFSRFKLQGIPGTSKTPLFSYEFDVQKAESTIQQFANHLVEGL